MSGGRKDRKVTTNARGRTSAQQEALTRTFGDLPVVDAKTDLRVPIMPVDIKKGVRKDPVRCALAQACIREWGSTAAVFFKTRAYVDIVGEDGVRRVERFTLSPASREVVESFDRGKPVPSDGRQMVLSAPTPGQTLDAEYARNKRYRRAVRKGTYTRRGPSRRGVSTPRAEPLDLEVRNGTGQWQMLQREAA